MLLADKIRIMLRQSNTIRYRLATILSMHFWAFVAQCRNWIRPVVFKTVRKIIACRTPELGYHVYWCEGCGQVKTIPHSCKSRFCPTCGKIATDQWANQVLNGLLDVPYHHLVLTVPWELRPLILMNREVTLSLLFKAAVKSISEWAEKLMGMRMGILAILHTG